MSSSLTTDLALRDLLEATNRLRETVLALADTVAGDQQPRTVTVDDLATATGLHPDTVKKHIEAGKLPGRKIDGRYVIPDLEFDAFRRGQWEPRVEKVPAQRPTTPMLHNVPKAG